MPVAGRLVQLVEVGKYSTSGRPAALAVSNNENIPLQLSETIVADPLVVVPLIGHTHQVYCVPLVVAVSDAQLSASSQTASTENTQVTEALAAVGMERAVKLAKAKVDLNLFIYFSFTKACSGSVEPRWNRLN